MGSIWKLPAPKQSPNQEVPTQRLKTRMGLGRQPLTPLRLRAPAVTAGPWNSWSGWQTPRQWRHGSDPTAFRATSAVRLEPHPPRWPRKAAAGDQRERSRQKSCSGRGGRAPWGWSTTALSQNGGGAREMTGQQRGPRASQPVSLGHQPLRSATSQQRLLRPAAA